MPLRAVLSGKVPAADFAGKRLYEVMDLCLRMQGLQGRVPVQRGMAKMKYEFLYHYHKVNGLPLATDLRAHQTGCPRGARGSPAPNWVAAWRPTAWLMERFAGIDRAVRSRFAR